ncbi:hypothetical protein [Endozoicomonas sp. ALB032]|uniref:hypothetical protein n=1 Tax=Endozoicomonas sp. ALB032 TaxID=3403082 RepID=UPI003BB4C9A2
MIANQTDYNKAIATLNELKDELYKATDDSVIDDLVEMIDEMEAAIRDYENDVLMRAQWNR